MTLDQRITLQKLEVLCLFVELGGVHQAAERLYVSQPVISAHLHSLEEQIGVPLFFKQARRLVLTDAGEAVLAWAQGVLNERSLLERKIEDIVDGVGGAVSIAASMTVGSYVLPPVLIQFRKANPYARITLLISDPETALQRVERGECEFCVIMSDAPINPQIFLARQIRSERYVVIAPPDSDLPDTIPVSLLGELSAICPPRIHAVRRLQDIALREVGVLTRPVVMELGSGEAIKQAVAAGIGIALISERVVESEVAHGELRQIEISDADLSHSHTYVQRITTVLSSLQRKMVEAICADSNLVSRE